MVDDSQGQIANTASHGGTSSLETLGSPRHPAHSLAGVTVPWILLAIQFPESPAKRPGPQQVRARQWAS